MATDVRLYFCDRRSPWQHGNNENTTGLLRQHFPKGIRVAGVVALERIGDIHSLLAKL